MRITCERHPNLLITHPRVEFVDGVADVDEETVKVLSPLLDAFGIDAADIGGEHAETKESPKRGKNG